MYIALHISKLDLNGELRSRQISKPIVPLVVSSNRFTNYNWQGLIILNTVLSFIMKMDLWIAAELS